MTPQETFGELLARMRTELVPRGNMPVVRLSVTRYVEQSTVAAAIDELERLGLEGRLEPTSALKSLGIMLLRDSLRSR